MFFFGDDTEIDLQAHEEREFLEYQWMRLEDLPEKVDLLFLPFHRHLASEPAWSTAYPKTHFQIIQ